MGWGVGMGIGWSTTPLGPNSFTIQNCLGQSYVVWSESSSFLPGAYIFRNKQLTDPFTFSGYWNLTELISTIGGYEVSNSTGELKDPLLTCPV
jgi:hypothetical protein